MIATGLTVVVSLINWIHLELLERKFAIIEERIARLENGGSE